MNNNINNKEEAEAERLRQRLASIRLLAMDVDGVLTDGTLAYDSGGGEQKRFHVADGLGLVLLRQVGIEIAWISGRASVPMERRARELGVRHVMQGVRDKSKTLREVCSALAIPLEETAYIGDDWNDLPALAIAGVGVAVANAVEEVKQAAAIITRDAGGQGAVREVCMRLIEARGVRAVCLQNYLALLAEPGEGGMAGQ